MLYHVTPISLFFSDIQKIRDILGSNFLRYKKPSVALHHLLSFPFIYKQIFENFQRAPHWFDIYSYFCNWRVESMSLELMPSNL